MQLFMVPAWQEGQKIAVKMVCIAPGNSGRGLPAVSASVILFDAVTGKAEAVAEGGELTARRTAAASALAADYLARKDAGTLLVVGAGTIAGQLIPAHCAVRPYRNVLVWARDIAKSERLAQSSVACAENVQVAASLEDACRQSDVITCATLAIEPLVHGAWLRPGTHVDLVGGYRPDMREADDEAVGRARGAIVVDTFDGALEEAGDVIQPLENGTIQRSDLAGDLAALCRNDISGRTSDDQITLFKSVGAALEDYAALRLAVANDANA